MTAQIDSPALTPTLVSIADWLALSGMSRTDTYRALKSGDLLARKLHRRCLIDYEHGIKYLRSLPAYQPR